MISEYQALETPITDLLHQNYMEWRVFSSETDTSGDISQSI